MKNEDKKMYIVRGSEDGSLGVFSNIKLAYECAVAYVADDVEQGTEKLVTYSSITKAFKEGYFCREVRDCPWGNINAEIQQFNLNNKYWEN